MKNVLLTVCDAPSLGTVVLTQKRLPHAVVSFDVPWPVCPGPFDSPRLDGLLQNDYWRERQLCVAACDVEFLKRKEFNGLCHMLVPPRREQINAIFDHVDRFSPAQGTVCLVVNCWAGVSRSTATALALLARFYPNEPSESLVDRLVALRPQADPNRTLVGYADDLLGRSGSLLAAVDTHAAIKANRRKSFDRDRWWPSRRGRFFAAPTVTSTFPLTL